MGRASVVIVAILVSAVPTPAHAQDQPTPPAAEQPPIVIEPPPDDAPVRPVAPLVPDAPAAAPTAATTIASAANLTSARPRRETHGLALAVGVGFAYGILGLQARYDIPIRPSLIVSPFVSAGVAFGVLSGPFGISAELGKRHRIAGDLALAPIERQAFLFHTTLVEGRTVYGPLVAVGYEHMSDSGWFQKATFEYGYEAWGSAVPSLQRHHVLAGGALGRRIW